MLRLSYSRLPSYPNGTMIYQRVNSHPRDPMKSQVDASRTTCLSQFFSSTQRLPFHHWIPVVSSAKFSAFPKLKNLFRPNLTVLRMASLALHPASYFWILYSHSQNFEVRRGYIFSSHILTLGVHDIWYTFLWSFVAKLPVSPQYASLFWLILDFWPSMFPWCVTDR